KIVLVVRTDLRMTGGKVASQCSHATLECYRKALKYAPEILQLWERLGQAKVTLKCKGENEMMQLEKAANEMGLVCHAFRDDGRTQIASGSLTVLGIGPGPVSIVNKVTGHLKL
ncbi:peptidyl-tRNA hydrolase, partial [Coemansia reversa NRRL 1564]